MLGFLVRLLISAMLVGILFYTIDLSAVLENLLKVDREVFVFGCIAVFGLTFLSALRWKIVLSEMKKEVTYKEVWKITAIGTFFNQMLPSSIGGDGFRILLIRKVGLELSKATISVFIDRFSGLFAILMLSIFTLPVMVNVGGNMDFAVSVAFVILALFVGTIVLLYLETFVRPFVKLLHLSRAALHTNLVKIIDLIFDLSPYLRRILFGNTKSVAIFILSIMIQLGLISVAVALCFSIGVPIGVWQGFAVVAPALLLGALPISFAGWGVREGAMVFTLGVLGVDHGSALAISLLFGLSITLGGLPGGLVWLMFKSSLTP